jgi:hypothetical protein
MNILLLPIYIAKRSTTLFRNDAINTAVMEETVNRLVLAMTIFVAFLTGTLSALAQSGPCTIDILSPQTNATVGETANIVGRANIPTGTKLWVFAHRKGLALWWPQGAGPAAIDGQNNWQTVVFFGQSRDIGSEFEITARVVDQTANNNLQQWVATAQSKQYPGIAMPVSVAGCLVKTVVVRRDQ